MNKELTEHFTTQSKKGRAKIRKIARKHGGRCRNQESGKMVIYFPDWRSRGAFRAEYLRS
jgi:hypothetical protein